MERPLEPNMGPSLADVLLCTFESTNAGFSTFPETSVLRVILVPLQNFLENETLHQVDSTEKKIIQDILQDNCHVPYFEYYVNIVVNVHVSNTEIEGK
jgi:hypothetical protein